ncbi:agouti-signaling protein-like isoform X1 [Xiphophorus maculatus]|nr:agouti-signaling protein-like isoform X1 [Xiphophorus maculatus]
MLLCHRLSRSCRCCCRCCLSLIERQLVDVFVFSFQRTMQAFLPLGCCVLALTQCCLGSAHMIPDDRLSTNRVVASNALSHSLQIDPPPVVIVELNKSTKKKEKGKKQKKNKFARKRPPPPPNCIPLWGSCKAPGNVCCDFCAFCQCRLFKTVCLCRMGNPRC